MRVTESLKYATVTSQLAKLQEQYLQAAQQSASGLRVTTPSDDPIAAAENARVQASISQTSACRNSITVVQSDTQLAESSLDSAGQVLQQALQLAMTGSNGSTSAEQMQTLATQAQQLVTQMISIGNTKGAQGYIFGGTEIDSAPFDASGNFLGNDESHEIQIGAGQPTVVNASGALAFTSAGGRDVIQDLNNLTSALSSGDTSAVSGLLDNLQSSYNQVVQERAHTGLILDNLTMSDSFLSQQGLDMQSNASSLTEADPTTAFSRLTQLQTAIQQTVTVDQQLLQTTSLANTS